MESDPVMVMLVHGMIRMMGSQYWYIFSSSYLFTQVSIKYEVLILPISVYPGIGRLRYYASSSAAGT